MFMKNAAESTIILAMKILDNDKENSVLTPISILDMHVEIFKSHNTQLADAKDVS